MTRFSQFPEHVQSMLLEANTRSLTRAFPDQDAHDDLARWRLEQPSYLAFDLPEMLLDVMALCWEQGKNAADDETCPYVPTPPVVDL